MTSPVPPSSVVEMMMFSTWIKLTLFSAHTCTSSFHHQWWSMTWSWECFWLTHRHQCKLPFAPVRRQGTGFADTRLIPKSSLGSLWKVATTVFISSTTSLTVRHQLARMVSRTCATVSSVWEVNGLPGWWLSSRIWCLLLKWENHSYIFDWLWQNSPKADCSIS